MNSSDLRFDVYYMALHHCMLSHSFLICSGLLIQFHVSYNPTKHFAGENLFDYFLHFVESVSHLC